MKTCCWPFLWKVYSMLSALTDPYRIHKHPTYLGFWMFFGFLGHTLMLRFVASCKVFFICWEFRLWWVLVGWKTVLHSPRWFLSLLGAVGACQVNDTAPHMGMGCMDLRCTPGSRCYCIQNYSKRLVIFRFVEFNLSVQSQPTSLSNRPGCWRQPVLSVFLTQGRQTKESQARTQTAVFVYMDPSSLRDCRAASSPKRQQSLCKRNYRYLQIK